MRRDVLTQQVTQYFAKWSLITCGCLIVLADYPLAGQDGLIEIGSRRELFVDDYLVERVAG